MFPHLLEVTVHIMHDSSSDIKICILVAALPDIWHYGAIARSSRPGVSLLRLSERASFIFSFYLSVAALAFYSDVNQPPPPPATPAPPTPQNNPNPQFILCLYFMFAVVIML